jgi:hypothetical protein
VAGIGTRWTQAYAGEGQGQIIDQRKAVFCRNGQLIEPVFYGAATQVHVGSRFNKRNAAAFEAALAYLGQPVYMPAGVMLFGEGIGDIETNIVAGMGIFGTYIAKACNQKTFHLCAKIGTDVNQTMANS